MKSLTKILSLLLVFMTTITLSSSAVLAAEPKEGDTASFQILFTSDTHGSFTNYNFATGKETVGGLTKLATLMKKEKADFAGKTFIIDVGDTIQGNGTSFFINNKDYKLFPNVALFNHIGYDAITVGNHEFNFGVSALYHAFDNFSGKKLCANVTYEDGSYLKGFEPYSIYTLEEGVRIAVIAAVTPNIEVWDRGNMAKDGLKADNAATQTRKIIDELKEKDLADIFVLAAHMGDANEYDRDGSGALDVAAMNPELAVILGAHYHTIVGTKDKQHTLGNSGVKFVENKNAGASYGKVLIDTIYEDGKWTIKNKSGNYTESGVKTDVIEVTADTPKDAAAEAVIAKATAAVMSYVNDTVVGTLKGGPLVPDPEIAGTYEGYLQDTALGDLINNAMLYFTKADISATAPLDTNSNHQPGKITIGGVVQIYKYDNNTLYKLKMTGSQILRWMEWSYSYFGSTIDGVTDHTKPAVNLETDLTIPTGAQKDYLQDQFAGIIYEVDLTKPVGERIKVISMADGTPFNTEKEYTVATNDYRASTQLLNNSEKGVFKPGEKTAVLLESDVQTDKGATSMLDIIIEYIGLQPNSVITNSCDNNWKFVNLDWDKDLREKAVRAINEGLIVTDFKTPVTKEQVLALNLPDKDKEESTTETDDTQNTDKGSEQNETEDKLTDNKTTDQTSTDKDDVSVDSNNGTRIHKVQAGDTLTKIAKYYYNDASQWRKIYRANKSLIKNSNLIYINQEIVIP